MRVDAFAKLTLSLRVTGVRADGYHELDAIMRRGCFRRATILRLFLRFLMVQILSLPLVSRRIPTPTGTFRS